MINIQFTAQTSNATLYNPCDDVQTVIKHALNVSKCVREYIIYACIMRTSELKRHVNTSRHSLLIKGKVALMSKTDGFKA